MSSSFENTVRWEGQFSIEGRKKMASVDVIVVTP